jgi:transposase
MSPRWMTRHASVGRRRWRAISVWSREYSSGEQQRRGHVMRSAHLYVHAVLVQAAWRIVRVKDPRTAALRTWADAIARRRGKKIAMVALARRLAGMLFAM